MKPLSHKQCLVCGLKATSAQYKYYEFTELFSIYQVGYKNVCGHCAVRDYIMMMMEGGYCEDY